MDLESKMGGRSSYIRVAFSAMKVLHSLPAIAGALLLFSCQTPQSGSNADAPEPAVRSDLPDSLDRGYDEEVHLKNVRQLTYGGDNAEAYWSFDGKPRLPGLQPQLGVDCDQIYVMDIQDGTPAETPPAPVSTGLGRTTCAYFMPGDSTVVYASTHAADTACPEVPRRGPRGYVWPISRPTTSTPRASTGGAHPVHRR